MNLPILSTAAQTMSETMNCLIEKQASGEELSNLEHLALVAMAIAGTASAANSNNMSPSWVSEAVLGWAEDQSCHPEQKILFEQIGSAFGRKTSPAEAFDLLDSLGFFPRGSRKNRMSQPVYTYVVRHPETKAVKIGRSIHPQKRIKDLSMQSGCILHVVAIIDKDIEQPLHKKFSGLRTVGEWFRDTDSQITNFVLSMAGGVA